MLTTQQIAHFETFGFLVLRRLFDERETDGIRRLLDEQLEADREGRPYDESRKQTMFGFLESRPELTGLLEDDRLYGPLGQLLGEGFLFSGSQGNFYSGDTQWHADSDAELFADGFRRIKLALYLDPLTAATGALRIIPGSHRAPLYHELDACRKRGARQAEWSHAQFGIGPTDMPGVALETVPGDLVLFDTHAWHASFGGSPARRMIAINFAQQPNGPEHDRFLRRIHEFNLRCIKENGYRQRDWTHGGPFMRCERPRIKRMIRRLVELGLT
jgi:hypothetical protein